MSRIVIDDKLPQFKRSLDLVLDDAFRETSRDILIKAKTRAPFLKGGLRADSIAKRLSKLKWRVSFNKEYAGYQEFGQRRDGSHKVRNYSTGGTGAHYLEKSGDEAVQSLKSNIKKHGLRARP